MVVYSEAITKHDQNMEFFLSHLIVHAVITRL
jgi:hypothetical protein